MDVGRILCSPNVRAVVHRPPGDLVLINHTGVLSPPRPATNVLIPEARGGQCFYAFFHLRDVRGNYGDVRPACGFHVVCAAKRCKDCGHHVARVPHVFANRKIVRVPTGEGRSSPFVLVGHLLACFTGQRIVRAFLSFRFGITRVGQRSDQVVAARAFRIATVFIAFPTSAMGQVIVVAGRGPLYKGLP